MHQTFIKLIPMAPENKKQLNFNNLKLQNISIDRFTLKFNDKELEKQFIIDYNQSILKLLRIALFTGAFLYAIFGILDSVMVGETKTKIWIIRYLIVCPSLLIGIILTFSRGCIKYLQFLISVLVIIGGLGIVAMLAMIPPPALYLYSQGILLVLMFNYTFLRLRFWYATINFLIIICAFEITSLLINPLPPHIFINNNFFLISANTIGMIVAYILENYARSYYLQNLKLSRLAGEDPLTGLLNRRAFLNRFSEELLRVKRYNREIIFAMIDLDNLKEINDQHGHPAGDEVIVSFAKVLSTNLRKTDIIGRIGGDEFGVILLNPVSEEDLLSIFRKITKKWISSYKSQEFEPSFCAGCIKISGKSRILDPLELYSKVDQALLKAKSEGRARIILIDESGRELLNSSLLNKWQ